MFSGRPVDPKSIRTCRELFLYINDSKKQSPNPTWYERTMIFVGIDMATTLPPQYRTRHSLPLIDVFARNHAHGHRTSRESKDPSTCATAAPHRRCHYGCGI